MFELNDVVEPPQLNEPLLPAEFNEVEPSQLDESLQPTDVGQSSRPANSELSLTSGPPALIDVNPLLVNQAFEPLDDYDWPLDPFPLDPNGKGWIFPELLRP